MPRHFANTRLSAVIRALNRVHIIITYYARGIKRKEDDIAESVRRLASLT
jgi:hypothetical protein